MRALFYILMVCAPKGHSVLYAFSSIPLFVNSLFNLRGFTKRYSASSRRAFLFVASSLFFCFLYSFFYGITVASDQDLGPGFVFDAYRYLFYFLIFLLGFSCDKNNQDNYLAAIKVVLVVNVIVVLLQKILGTYAYTPFTMRSEGEVAVHYLKRAIGTVGNPNILGAYFSALTIFFFYKTYKNKEKCFLLFLMSFFIVALSQSRTSLLFLIFALLLLLFSLRNVKLLIAFLCLFPPLVYYVYSIGFLSYIVSGFLTVAEHGLMAQSSFAARVDYWEKALQLISQNWLLGSGYYLEEKGVSVVDNAYLYSVVKYGAFGVLYWLAVLTLFFRMFFVFLKDKNNVFSLLSLCFGYIIITTSLVSDMGENLMLASSFFLYSGISIRKYKANEHD